MDRSYFNTFDELYILMLSRKQGSYSQASANALLADQFSFDCKRHIIDLNDILGQVSGLRLAAQESVLAEFKHILGEVDAYISYITDGVPAPVAITSNLQRIRLPSSVVMNGRRMPASRPRQQRQARFPVWHECAQASVA